MNPVLPMVHLNGTSQKTLFEGYLKARDAILDAMHAMNEVTFHSRDYYTIGNGAWPAAVSERREEMAKLEHVYQYLSKHIEHIADQR
jgi:hypothetical protein